MPTQQSSQDARAQTRQPLDTRSIVLFYLVVGLGAVLWKEEWRAVALQWWWASLTIVLLLLVFLFLPYTRRWLQKTGTPGRAALLVFVVMPSLLALVSLFVFLLPRYQFYVLRSLYLVVVILFPGVMFYLFIANRKTSLLNEFVANLDRLGLVATQRTGTQSSYRESQSVAVLSGRRRFESYRRKFEAIYGTVPLEMWLRALEGTDSDSGSADSPPGASAPPRIEKVLTVETTIPVAIATLLIALGWLLTLPLMRLQSSMPAWIEALTPVDSPVQFAFLGAYFFSLQMLFRRYVLRDLRPSAYVAISMRIILAVIGTWVVTGAPGVMGLKASPSTFLVVGFTIGVFPPVVWQFVESAFKKITGAGFLLPSLRSQLPISDLDGLTVWHEARLEEEGIENIPNMATADVVELMVQTRLPPDRIIDWVDQAILYTNLGPEEGKDARSSPRRRLRAHGIRTASSLQVAYQNSAPGPDREAFESILSPPVGDGDRSPMRALAETLATNPNSELVRAWKGLAEKRAL